MVQSFETIQSVFRETLYRKAQVLQKSRERGSLCPFQRFLVGAALGIRQNNPAASSSAELSI